MLSWHQVSIDKTSHEIVPSEEKLKFETGKLGELQDELPDNAPRFVLLSYEVSSISSCRQESLSRSLAHAQRRKEK